MNFKDFVEATIYEPILMLTTLIHVADYLITKQSMFLFEVNQRTRHYL